MEKIEKQEKREEILGLIQRYIADIIDKQDIKVIGLDRCIISKDNLIVRGNFFDKLHSDFKGEEGNTRGVIIKLKVDGIDREILFLYDNIEVVHNQFYQIISPNIIKTLSSKKQHIINNVISQIRLIEQKYRKSKGIGYTKTDKITHKVLDKIGDII